MLLHAIIFIVLPLVVWTQVPNIEIRLVPPTTQGGLPSQQPVREGRLEVRYNDRWGTVCDDGWSVDDAVVACYMLGFTREGFAVRQSEYGAGQGPIWLRDVKCFGDESSLAECMHDGWGNTAVCDHTEDAGVRCTGTLRNALPQPTSRAGNNGTNTNLVTSQPIVVINPSRTNDTITLVVHEQPNQLGSQPRTIQFINTCPQNSGRLRNDVRLVRYNDMPANSGRVEINRSGQWGTICDDGFDALDAQVVCRMLCLSAAEALAFHSPTIGNLQNIPVHLTMVNCQGAESDIANCPHSGWGVITDNCRPNVQGRQDVAISCGPFQLPFSGLQLTKQPQCQNNYLSVSLRRADQSTTPMPRVTVLLQTTGQNPLPNQCQPALQRNDSHVSLSVLLDSNCPTVSRKLQHTTIDYQIILLVQYAAAVVGASSNQVRRKEDRLTIICQKPRHYNRTLNYQVTEEPHQLVTLRAPFKIEFAFFQSAICENYVSQLPHTATIGDWVYSGLKVSSVDQVKLVVQSCYATPTRTVSSSTPRHQLLQDRCAVEQTFQLFYSTQKSSCMQFRAFTFSNSSNIGLTTAQIWLHCDVRVCGVEETNEQCDQSCRTAVTARKRRAVHQPQLTSLASHEYHFIQGPILILDNQSPAKTISLELISNEAVATELPGKLPIVLPMAFLFSLFLTA